VSLIGRISIRWKLILGIFGMTLATMSIAGVYYPQKMYAASYARMQAEVSAVQRILCRELSTAVEFADAKAATAGLQAVTDMPEIEYAGVSLRDGQVLARVGRAELAPAWGGDALIQAAGGGYFRVQAPILGIEGQPQGRLVLVSSMKRLAAQRRAQLREMVMIAVGFVLLGVVVALVLHRTVASPIIRVTQGVRRVAEGWDAADAPVASSDEIGELAASFNRMRRQLRETTVSKVYVDDIVDGIADILLVVAPDGTLRSANRAARELLGLPAAPAGRALADVVVSPPRADLEAIFRSPSAPSQPRAFELTFRSAAGTTVPATALASTVVDRMAGTSSQVLVARDMRETLQLLEAAASAEAERRKADELTKAYAELAEAHRQLKEAQAQLVQSGRMAAVGQMAAGIAHEINNPLSAVLTYAEVFAERLQQAGAALPPSLADADTVLQRIRAGAARCKSISDNLLSFSRQPDRRRVPVNLARVVDLTLELMQIRIDRSGLKLVCDVSPSLWVLGAESSLQQVLTNLVVNAMQAMGAGGTLTIRARAADGKAELEVVDTGSGMSPEVMEHIFEPFFTTKPVGQGTGLGLFIVHGLVTELGGTITVDSRPGAGAQFGVTLELAASVD
jgi:two-component system, NtrC family, phosphoglycerate transport system sensor histidine kinase PgtB